jgi:hypothetical protein
MEWNGMFSSTFKGACMRKIKIRATATKNNKFTTTNNYFKKKIGGYSISILQRHHFSIDTIRYVVILNYNEISPPHPLSDMVVAWNTYLLMDLLPPCLRQTNKRFPFLDDN